MKKKNRYVCKPAVIGALFGGLVNPVMATSDFSFTAGTGVEFHDNANLASENEESDTAYLLNADIGYEKTGGALEVDLNYGLEYSDYKDNVVEDETAVNGDSSLRWDIAPRVLDAFLNHQISQQLADRRQVDVSNNRERRSIITAGLNGYLHFSPVDSLVLSPRFVDISFSDSKESDSQRAGGSAMWEHKTSEVSALDLSASYDEVTFDQSQNDYDYSSAMLLYRTTLSRLSYQIGVGANKVQRDVGKDSDGPVMRAGLDYQGAAGQNWGATYVHQLTDTSIGLSGSELALDNFQTSDSGFDEFDIVEEDQVDIYWNNRISAATQISLGAGYQMQDYQDTLRDQDEAYVQAAYQYTINSSWSLDVAGRFGRTKFDDDPADGYDTTEASVGASYRPLRPLEIRFSLGWEARDSDVENSDYTDRIAMVGVRYQFF